MNHPLRDGHPEDSALGDVPLVSLGQGDYRHDIMPGDVSPGHTQHAESKAIDALTRDAVRSGTVPLADAKPPVGHDATVGTDAPKRPVLPTLKPIMTQVRKLELSARQKSPERLAAEAAADQSFSLLRDHELDHVFDILEQAAKAEVAGKTFAINGYSLVVMRRALACLMAQLEGSAEDIREGGAQ